MPWLSANAKTETTRKNWLFMGAQYIYDEIIIFWSQVRSTLFVSNLPYTATSVDLQTLFSDIAPVRSAFVITEHGTGVSKGVGYVSFSIKDDAESAYNKILNEGITLNGRKLRADWADRKVWFNAITGWSLGWRNLSPNRKMVKSRSRKNPDFHLRLSRKLRVIMLPFVL